MTRITLAVALVMALSTPAAAQTGRVYGVVVDPSGAVLPAVEVRATMRDTGGETTRRVVTDAKGSYDLSNLGPGAWALTMTLAGFETASHRVTLQGTESLEWSPELQLGTLQETVTITTGATSRAATREELATPPQVPLAAPPPPALPPPPPGVIRVGGSIKPPRKLVNVNPVYPAEAASQGISGVVILRAVIGADGFVREITTVRSPNESLTLAATGAFNEWQFTPTLLNGVPVPVRMVATFNFQRAF